MSITWVIYLIDWDNKAKVLLIPDEFIVMHIVMKKGETRYKMSPRPISLLVG